MKNGNVMNIVTTSIPEAGPLVALIQVLQLHTPYENIVKSAELNGTNASKSRPNFKSYFRMNLRLYVYTSICSSVTWAVTKEV